MNLLRSFGLLAFVFVSLFSMTARSAAEAPSPPDLLKNAKRILFLGDSITASGQYVAYFESWLICELRSESPTIINCGLPSETVSGLSEEGHAGGKFPRPDLFERLSRVLNSTRPDLVVACYGINCGIYEPFDEKRFARYQDGIRRLKADVEKRNAKLVVITPPFYDDLRAPKKFSYNGVLDRYSEWLVAQGKSELAVIDLHASMTREVAAERAKNPKFHFQPDGVHPNDAGHWFMARKVIEGFSGKTNDWKTLDQMLTAEKAPAELAPLVLERMSLRRDAYVSDAGHKRPGVAEGLHLGVAEKKATVLSIKIQSLFP